VTGDVTATTGGVGTVQGGGDVTGAVTAGTSVSKVQGGGTVTSDVTANGGDIKKVQAGTSSAPGNIEGRLEATGSVKTVKAYGDFTGDIDATVDVNSVTARSILGEAADHVFISAGRYVKTVKTTGRGAGEGDILNVDVQGGRDVKLMNAKDEIIDSTVTAGRHVGTVQATNDITGTRVESGTDAGGNVTKVKSVSGDIVDPLIIAGEDAGPDGIYGGAAGEAADNIVRSGQVKNVEARRGNITGAGFIVGADQVKTVRDGTVKRTVSWDDVIIVEGQNEVV